MSLSEMFAAMHEVLTGTVPIEEASARLYGEEASRSDGRHLAVYRRSYRANVESAVESLFPVTKAVATALGGDERWSQLERILATDRTLGSIRFGAAPLVDIFAGDEARELGFPPWLAELADLELWERRIFLAPDAARRSVGPLAVAEPSVLRVYAHDVLAVRMQRGSGPLRLSPRRTLIVIWRDRDDLRRTKRMNASEMRILDSVLRHGRLCLGEASRPAGDLASYERAATRLTELGLIRSVVR